MADIFVELDGIKTLVTKDKLFELAASGHIDPNSRLWVGEKETVCRHVRGIVFSDHAAAPMETFAPTKLGAEVPNVIKPSEESGPEQVFEVKAEPLPQTPSMRVTKPVRNQEEEDEKEEEQRKKEKNIIMIVTLISVFILMILSYGVVHLMFGNSPKKKTDKAKTEKKERVVNTLPTPAPVAPQTAPSPVPLPQQESQLQPGGQVPTGQPQQEGQLQRVGRTAKWL